MIFNGVPPYSLLGASARVGRIPPHRTDAGSFLLAECFGCATLTLIKDVDGLYDRDPKEHPNARFIDEITVSELRERKLPTLPFDRALIDLLEHARLVNRVQIINGHQPSFWPARCAASGSARSSARMARSDAQHFVGVWRPDLGC